MNKKSHYKRANKGFKINGITYKRLFCTTGGVKMSTVVYASERVVDELKKRINNGRDETKKIEFLEDLKKVVERVENNE
jgi:hypothetical protein